MLEQYKPKKIDDNYRTQYNRNEVTKFFSLLNFETADISGKKLFLECKTISQSKIREAGFTIVRNKDKADIVVIDDIIKKTSSSYWDKANIMVDNQTVFSLTIDKYIFEESKGYKYVLDSQLYKYLYKYDGNYDLFKQLSELLESKSDANTTMAMEMMSNANWNGNKIYLMEMFNNYYNNGGSYSIRYNDYKNSISFKGFIESLDFDYKYIHLSTPNDYRLICETDDHHDWVFNKYKSEFEEYIKNWSKRYKISIDEFKYSIDKTIPDGEGDVINVLRDITEINI